MTDPGSGMREGKAVTRHRGSMGIVETVNHIDVVSDMGLHALIVDVRAMSTNDRYLVGDRNRVGKLDP